MSIKTTGSKAQTGAGRPRRSPTPALAVEDDERHAEHVAGYVARNKDALNASIRRARKEAAEGIVSEKTIETIIAEGRRRHERE
jgi:hypothetical protein